ncbi:hypothetical protein AURDEDRAFT_171990 [Auricularia subglabra TFB-10046 SS5]|nr:hypothetical protein AURDEDRAFT_171990 [Auricularia subglabra TFB-10046 SS5]
MSSLSLNGSNTFMVHFKSAVGGTRIATKTCGKCGAYHTSDDPGYDSLSLIDNTQLCA